MINDRHRPSTPPPGSDHPAEVFGNETSVVTSRRRASRKLRVPNDPVPRRSGEISVTQGSATALVEPTSSNIESSGTPSSPSNPLTTVRPRSVPPPPPLDASSSEDVPLTPSSVSLPGASIPPPGEDVVSVRQVRRKIRAVGTADATSTPDHAAHNIEPSASVPTASLDRSSYSNEQIEEPTEEIAIPVPALPSLPTDPSDDDFVIPPVDVTEPAQLALRPPAVPPIEVHDDEVDVSIEDEGTESEGTHADPSTGWVESLSEEEVVDEPTEEITIPEEIQQTPSPRRSVPPPPPPPRNTEPVRPPPPPPASTARPAEALTKPPREEKKKRRPWWEELFGDDYFRTMPKYTPAQIAHEVNFIESSLGVEKGALVLDIACGEGRQAIELAMRGYEVIALDLSLAMLSRAADNAQARGAKLNFLHSDMREMEFNGLFDAAYCMNTSFGFFDDDTNADVIRRVFRALKPGGTLLLDVHNRDYALQHVPSMAWYEGDGCVCMEETSFNYIKSRLCVKRTMLFEDGRQREIEYSIRLYSLHELGQLLHDTGFRIVEVSGSVHTPGAFFGPTSRQLIILAQKPTTTVNPENNSASSPPEQPRS